MIPPYQFKNYGSDAVYIPIIDEPEIVTSLSHCDLRINATQRISTLRCLMPRDDAYGTEAD